MVGRMDGYGMVINEQKLGYVDEKRKKNGSKKNLNDESKLN